ncbi:hypothetical protein J41TS12_48720 [Paenibacillus antibioticophila]|uniref:Uncharacterized protein n=1 Tax=Paenibacillus antibioticophila TaxID=1274374 RepID=A0A919XVE7_9BACL|nr:hypothetical protein [Paenibacillus antibioticophila]GIO40011.1 hypothetical protein J41TS12_48720 [Paenibacillus antibioticophila]
MRGYNFTRPLMLIAIAVLTNFAVTSICMLFGMTQDSASSLGTMAMVIAALWVFSRQRKKR